MDSAAKLKVIHMFNTMPPQFILWKSVPDMPPKKPRKVPCDVTGAATDPHDKTKFMDYETAATVAAGAGLNIGFVLTKEDPYFLFDLDDVRNPVTGDYTDIAQAAAALFPGAAMEVSYSQTGMHIYGRCDAERLRTKKRKWQNNQFEFYTEGRFVALGHGAVGDINIDWTQQLDGLIPTRDVADLEAGQDGPVPEYTGTNWSDEELVQKMLAGGGSMAVQFGDKASVRDLWTCDVAKLAAHFPSATGDLFDRSNADAALMSHLAFWCGKDYQRMDKLFRASGLFRDKYDKRPDYRQNTITGAISGCRNVYSVAAKTTRAPLISGELMTIQDQLEHFKGCVYVAARRGILTPTGEILDRSQFRATYGGFKFLMTMVGTGSTTDAFEAFTEHKVTAFPKVSDITFDPTGEFQDILTDPDGIKRVNVYRPRTPRRVSGDPSLFVDLITTMIPDERDRVILTSYMAAVCQYPGQKFLWAPLVQGAQGNGKSTLISVLRYCVDGITQGVDDQAAKYSVELLPRHLDSQFNGVMESKLLAVVHEMHTDSFKDQRERQDYLKSLITEPTLTIERKGANQYTARNCMNFLFCSNHRDAVRLESAERRFAVFYTAQQTVDDVRAAGIDFKALWSWLRADGFAIVYDYLMTYQIPDEFNPAGDATRAPVTSSTAAAVSESRSPVERLILEAVADDEPGFKNGWVSVAKVNHLCERDGIKPLAGRALPCIMRALGYNRIGRVRANVLFEGGGATTLWCREQLGQDAQIADHAPSHLVEKYRADQQYSVPVGFN